ncbi:putative SV2-like protein 1 [Operophtera brumata]|uniref:Putative SV2-like protein 1 n=1 Tax=Operophtera brumata TaxID=104452 RepID=A0A0L7LGY5_OPEBR|nr:putative SV2-like protein 1 [Operophtera brumata]
MFSGNGWYSLSLLAVLSMATLSMAVEIFGISVILTGANCEFNLDLSQTSTLLTVTFIGNSLVDGDPDRHQLRVQPGPQPDQHSAHSHFYR